jgi:hypothetical protein
MSEDSEKSSARFAIILTVVVVLVATYCLQFGLQTLLVIESRMWASSNPWLRDVPKPLAQAPTTNITASAPKGSAILAQVRINDYEFSAPWPSKSKQTTSQLATEVRFDSGQVILFYDPQTQVDTLHVLRSSEPIKYLQFQRIFADRPIESNYALYKAVYEASPAQVSAFMPANDATRINTLLLWKLSFGFDAYPGIYSFDFGQNRGFQFGDPKDGRPVAVRVFDDRDQQFRLTFSVAYGSTGQVTQDDINTILQSLRTVPILEQ